MIKDTSGRQWTDTATMFRYYSQEGFVVGFSHCLDCAHDMAVVADPRIRLDTLKCEKCAGTSSAFAAAPGFPPTAGFGTPEEHS